MRYASRVGGLTAVALTVAALSLPLASQEPAEPEPLGPPTLYDRLREAELRPVGHITDGRLTVDRFEFTLTDGDLYLLSPTLGRAAVAVFLGDGLIRCYPPDGVEHQQLERFLDDDDFLDESFDKFVFWFSDDTGKQLLALADAMPGRDADDANDLLKDRRHDLLEEEFINPDSRVLVDLLEADRQIAPTHGYFLGQIDTDDHGWITVEIEPREPEEVSIYRFDNARNIADIWMGFHALWDFDTNVTASVFDGFPRDPEVHGKVQENDDDDDDWHARDLGLSHRPLVPDHERWSPRLSVARTDVDLALDRDGDATASAALVIDPHESMAAFRLRISPLLEVTEVRWRLDVPAQVENVRDVTLLTGESRESDEPVALDGTLLHFVQETEGRLFAADMYEPWVTIALPRTVAAGERFIVELSYEGALLDDVRNSNNHLLKDTVYWMPRHPDNRRTRMSLTYRVPSRFRIASGTDLVDEHLVDGTRITRWVSADLIRSMSFNYGQLEVSQIERPGFPRIEIYADKNHLGLAPGNREKTIDDLIGSIQTYRDYFGPYPFESLLVTETPANSGQSFPGLILLSFQAFGELHSGESELFRAHEVAHQWWGIGVDWKDYRDQWISEGFADYSAALYVLTGLTDEEQFLDMLDAWRHDVLGEVNVGQGLGFKHYGLRPAIIKRSKGNEAGPLVVGHRLNTSDHPMEYRILAYEKGAFILHMLRMLLSDLETGDDSRFRTLMRGFVADHLDEAASTSSFERAVTAAFGESMAWFFDQWVYGVDVPTYRPDLEVSRVLDQRYPFLLHGTVRQEHVPSDFRMPVPIRVQFEDRPALVQRVWIDQETVDIEIPLPAEPTDVEFNYHYAVLAQVR